MPNIIEHFQFSSRFITSEHSLILPIFNQDEYDVDFEDLLHTVRYHLVNQNKKYLIFNDVLESPRMTFFEWINNTGVKLLDSLQISPSSCRYLNGAMQNQHNTTKYINLINTKDLLRIPICYSNYFEKNFSNTLNSNDRPIFNADQPNKKTKFLFLAGSPRSHRIWLLVQSLKHGLTKSMQYSLFSDKKSIYNRMHSLEHVLFNEEDLNFFANSNVVLPSYVNIYDFNWSRQHQLKKSDVEVFSDSYLSIVAETVFFQQPYGSENRLLDNGDSYHYDFTFITEKTYRAIALKHPFVLASLPYSLKALREAGYKTFSPYIDESYDEIEDDFIRLQTIFDVLRKFNDYSQSELIEFYNNIKPIVEYNYDLIKNKTFNNTL